METDDCSLWLVIVERDNFLVATGCTKREAVDNVDERFTSAFPGEVACYYVIWPKENSAFGKQDEVILSLQHLSEDIALFFQETDSDLHAKKKKKKKSCKVLHV